MANLGVDMIPKMNPVSTTKVSIKCVACPTIRKSLVGALDEQRWIQNKLCSMDITKCKLRSLKGSVRVEHSLWHGPRLDAQKNTSMPAELSSIILEIQPSINAGHHSPSCAAEPKHKVPFPFTNGMITPADFVGCGEQPASNPQTPPNEPLVKPVVSANLYLLLARMVIYINKVYQDVGAVQTYYDERSFYFAIISVLSLVSPSLIYAIYLSFEEIIRANKLELKTITTKFVNGLLLMPWQIKRHLDGLYFASQRLCSFRPGKPDEMENITVLNRNAEVLEFFEDFYAGFLQILLQLYILSMQVNNLLDKSSLLVGELIGSALSIFSMLIAIRRRDDGILTGLLSFIGWISMFTSRVVVFALATTIFRVWFVGFCLIHAIGFSIWVYGIAVNSHNEPTNIQATDNPEARPVQKNRFHLSILVFLFFGLPSLVMWPIMFQLKEQKRPLVFLFVNTIENGLLLILWFFLKKTNSSMDFYSLLVVVIGTLVADLFLSGYILCKPTLTDQVVLHDMRYTETESFGMYYEFCDIVFRLKVRSEFREELEEVRTGLGTNNAPVG